MRFTCNKDELEKSLSILIRVTNPSATLESLRGVRILVDPDGVITLSATNLEIGIRTTVIGSDTEDGSVVINPRILLDTIKYSSSNLITCVTKGGVFVVTQSSGTTNIKTLNQVDFPIIPTPGDELPVTVQTKTIIQGTRAVLYAVSKSIIKPELASVYIWQDGQELVFVATDSFRLAEKRVHQSLHTDNDTSLLVPYKNIQELVGILELLDDTSEAQVAIERDQLAIRVGSVSMVIRTLDSAFPDYRKIVPKEPVGSIKLIKKDVVQLLRKTAVFSDKFNKIVLSMNSATNSLLMSTSSQEVGEMQDTLTGEAEGQNIEISVNYQYVADCLQSIESDSVMFNFFGISKPIIIHGVGDKSFMYLVMPMNR